MAGRAGRGSMSINGHGMDPLLTRLRRHARAMVGKQTPGDAYVAAVLEIMRSDATVLRSMSGSRIGLFKLFTQLVTASMGASMGECQPTGSQWAGKPFPVPRQMRQVLLLISVEQFSPGEVAEIMGISEGEVAVLADAACESLGAIRGADVMIIESEPLIAMNIGQIVTELGLRVNSMPPTHDRALTILRRDTPDLIIADGGCHPGMVQDLYMRAKPPVVFISAFPEMLLTGDRPEPVFVAPKPFDPAEIKALIYLALLFASPD